MSVDTKKEYYSNILDQRSVSAKVITSALDVVRQFIIDRKRIMVGGMMADMAIKLKGDQLYGPDVLPDYDFYSPNHYRDAYDLGEILCKKEFTAISVIPARHTTTMRVRIDFQEVADITYCPQVLFDRIPTLSFGKFIIRHPHIQMLDQHLALSKPFTNPGQEVIFERWKKDCVRYDVLYKHYPIPEPPSQSIPSSKQAYYTPTIPPAMLKGNALTGWAGMCMWNNPKAPIKLPKWAPISLLSTTPEMFDKFKPVKWKPYFDQIPARITFTAHGYEWEVFDTSDMRVGAHMFPSGIVVCNLQYIMVYLLSQLIYSNPDNEAVVTYAQHCYNNARKLIIASYTLPEEEGRHYRPTVELYGTEDVSHATNIRSDKFNATLNKTPILNVIPSAVYPKYPKCIANKTFDISSSKYFDIDGSQSK